MSDGEYITDALDARFFAPLRRKRTHRIGVELEFPIWNLQPGAATDFTAVHEATDEFLSRFTFTNQVHDDEGAIYRATDSATGDELSFDCSYNTLELSFGPGENLIEIQSRFVVYYAALQKAFGQHGHALTGMGINPRWRENRPEPIGNGRYRMLLHHLKSYSKYGGSPRFHDHPDFGLFSCSSQTHIARRFQPNSSTFSTLRKMAWKSVDSAKRSCLRRSVAGQTRSPIQPLSRSSAWSAANQ